jgi:hypothetical protein
LLKEKFFTSRISLCGQLTVIEMKLDELKSSPTSFLALEPDKGLEEDPPRGLSRT